MIGPVCLAVTANVCTLAMAVRAAFTLKEHILGFGNLRTLLWLSVASLPMLGTTWTLSVLAASDNSAALSYLLSTAVFAHAAFSLLGYCFVNGRVRDNLCASLRKCFGRKSPLLDGANSSSSGVNAPHQQRSSLAYASEASSRRRGHQQHAGVSTSSTTSRSTSKTASSPYRSDAHLRHTSTSTSNYNSSEPYLVAPTRPMRLLQASTESNDVTDSNVQHHHRRRRRRESDESDESDDGLGAIGELGGPSAKLASLELASSHSSDEDDVAASKSSHKSVGVSTQQTQRYLPSPDILCSSANDLFPNIKPIYAPRWSSQLPETYLIAAGEITYIEARFP